MGGKRKARASSPSSPSERIEDAERILEDSESGESDMFPGGIDPAPSTSKAGKKKDAGGSSKPPKPRNPKSKTDSSTGRRIEKEEYKSQRIYKDFVNCHLLNWLDETDPTFLSKDALKDARRIKLFSAILFNFGWFPWEAKAGDTKAAVIRAAQGQYERRNRPAARTGWGINEMHSFSKWQLREYQKGRLKKDAIGGWAWKLPARDPETGAPAPLPKEVQDFVDNRGRAAGKKNKDKEKTKRKAASESPSENDKEKRKRKAKSESASESEHDTESTGGQIEDYTVMRRSTDGVAMLTQSLGCSVWSAITNQVWMVPLIF